MLMNLIIIDELGDDLLVESLNAVIKLPFHLLQPRKLCRAPRHFINQVRVLC